MINILNMIWGKASSVLCITVQLYISCIKTLKNFFFKCKIKNGSITSNFLVLKTTPCASVSD